MGVEHKRPMVAFFAVAAICAVMLASAVARGSAFPDFHASRPLVAPRLEPEVVPTRPAPEHVAGDVTAAETGPASVPLAGAASTTPARATGPAVVSALVEGLATGHVNADTTTPQTPTAARTTPAGKAGTVAAKAARKAERDAAKAERKAEREAAKAERKAERDAAKAQRKAERDAAKAQRKAERNAERKAEREAAKAQRKVEREAAKAQRETVKAQRDADREAAQVQREAAKDDRGHGRGRG